MAVDCPDNSTECLLRALIETTASQTSPWEPRSFGFTVAIGVAAFLISFVAIFQGLFAAGPGRIKASASAIGVFSKLSKGRLSWIEFAWRSTAYTPLITYDDLHTRVMKQTPCVPHGTNYPFRAGTVSTGATWLHLLRCVGLDEEVEEIFDGLLQPCATDHLPADIQAPPMLIQLHCLAILAAIADPTTRFEKADRFILIKGRISQISFREHPVLGTLGAYERYQTQTSLYHHTSRPTDSPATNAILGRCSSLALDLAGGRLRVYLGYGKSWAESHEVQFTDIYRSCSIYLWRTAHSVMPHLLCDREEPFARALALTVAQTDYQVRPFPWKRLRFDEVTEWLAEKTSDLLHDVDSLKRYLELGECHIFSMDFTHRNKDHDTIFEHRGSWVVFDDPQCDIGGDFGEYFVDVLFKICTTFLSGTTMDQKGSNTGVANPMVLRMEPDEELCLYLKHVDILLRRKRVQAMDALDAITFRAVSELAAQERAAQAATTPVQGASPASPSSSSSVVEQTTADGTSSTPAAVAVSSRKSSGSTGTNISPRGMPNVLNGSPATEALITQTAASVSQEHLPQQKPKVTDETYLQALLLIRAILYAALLKLGPDTSMLFEPDFNNTIVKIM
ncbi:hypothetical protein H2198_008580 [Neophaeococcomyces mojaviensis]|uniref:Uncharacterized protein n=1 Tax=Neophaeococcomyces mojaviensis TaxID=3383035 RepID=A0ACC2ZWR7_9EURO|nr:hypothetical protein H2198_008580 [Knufia sp. JES_112]